MYVCMYVCMHACMHVHVYYICICAFLYAVYIWMYIFRHCVYKRACILFWSYCISCTYRKRRKKLKKTYYAFNILPEQFFHSDLAISQHYVTVLKLWLKIIITIRPHVLDLSFIETHKHQKIKGLFCRINFDCYNKFCQKCFSFYLFSFKYKKRKIHTKRDCASRFTLKSDSHLTKKNLFASVIALQKSWKMVISS